MEDWGDRLNKENKRISEEGQYKKKFQALLDESRISNSPPNKIIIPFSDKHLKGIHSIIKITYVKISLHKNCKLDDVYMMFLSRIDKIPLECFDYPNLINLLWIVSNNILISLIREVDS